MGSKNNLSLSIDNHTMSLLLFSNIVCVKERSTVEQDSNARQRPVKVQKAGLLPGRGRYTGKQSNQAKVSKT